MVQLNEHSVVPLYYQLKEILQEQIKGGAWAVGQEVPTERDLAETYAVSRSTVRQALQELEMEGLVTRKQGKGTFVARPKLAVEPSLTPQMRAQGLKPGTRIINAIREQCPSARIATTLQLNPTDEIFIVMRLRLANGEPVALETLYVPAIKAPGLLEQSLEHTNVLNYITEQSGLHPTNYVLTIEPVLISEFEATQMEAVVGMPALLLERIVYSDATPLMITKRVTRGDRVKFLTVGDSKGTSLQMEFNIPPRVAQQIAQTTFAQSD
ncbi:MAG: GntR family transcriptional regulator [Chloroflexi bacterium]|nr:GntR family transcriptional regulator [Chloroflexota bacterium]